jgi:hypothetical protein
VTVGAAAAGGERPGSPQTGETTSGPGTIRGRALLERLDSDNTACPSECFGVRIDGIQFLTYKFSMLLPKCAPNGGLRIAVQAGGKALRNNKDTPCDLDICDMEVSEGEH